MASDINQSAAPSNQISVIFLHHSTGANLIKDGNVRTLLQQRAPFISFWDHGYNPKNRIGKFAFTSSLQSHMYGLHDATGRVHPASFHVPNNNTDPDGLATLFRQPATNPPTNALSSLLQFDVVIFKSCFPVTAIASDEQLHLYQKHYITIRDMIDKYRDKLFIPMTPPPLRASMTNVAQAERARRFANWMMSEEYHEQRPHLRPYDFFSQLAVPEIHHLANTLRPEFCRHSLSNSHPNRQANRTVALHWAAFFIEAVRQTAFFCVPPSLVDQVL